LGWLSPRSGNCHGAVKGSQRIGLLAFAILAIVLVMFVAAVAFGVGHEVAAAERALSLVR
jgi:hypothetical protein